ncbi:hypothetical protein [Saccharopolyspora spinosa]|uniref:hypothetical protein n=1 Tax=Saccharopolyspora spinosa TaxID=60894 RepID=UPI000237AB13|nr:hypothetical protein [Saccharopolyspora spinosa]
MSRASGRFEAAHPGRFLLGIGAGHRELGTDFRSRHTGHWSTYLDVLDESGVPKQRRAPELVGPDALLAVKHKVALRDSAKNLRRWP